MVNFKIGCDPEIFLLDAHDALVAACGRIGGTKEFPRPLVELGDGFAIQEDNVAIEFNIPPAEQRAEWVASVHRAMNGISAEVAQQGLHFSKDSAALFPKSELAHPAALEFGCDPDFNAWDDGEMNPKPKADDETLRSCGGHIHIGLGRTPNKKDALNIIKLMDLHASVPAVLMDRGWLRKKLYGKPGAFRPKFYGLEYRSLSNFWVFSEELTGWAYDVTAKALDDFQNGKYVSEQDGHILLEAINNNNVAAAKDLIEKHQLLVL